MSLVSIIVPVYNIENYIEKCITSILAQNYQNIEVLLINDGSTDSSPSICEKYANIDSRIVLINKENGGLSDARNVGIEAAKGDYITFVDGDDYIAENYISVLYEKLIETDADISMCNYLDVYVGEKTRLGNNSWKENNQLVFSGIEGIKNIVEYKAYVNMLVTWNKLYKIEFFSDIRFPKGRIHEDNFTTYKLFYMAKKIVYVNEPLYYYIHREGSITNSGFSVKAFDLVEAGREFLEFCSERNIFVRDAAKSYLKSYWKFIDKYKKYNNKDKSIEKKYVKDFIIEYRRNKHLLSVLDRLKMTVFICFPQADKIYMQYKSGLRA